VIGRSWFFLKQALSALSRSLGITILAVVTIGVALAVLATFVVIVENLSRVADELGQEVDISAYLAPQATREASQRATETISSWEEVMSVRQMSSEQAMKEFRGALGDDAVLLDGLPADVIPPSLEVRLKARAWSAAEVRGIADRVGKLEGIDDVRFGQEEIERVGALLGFARIAALVMGAALSFATILIISNTIRLTVYARRDEIEIMGLVGATNSFVRAPFVLEGAIQGFLGGLIALGALVTLEEGLEAGIQRGLTYAYGPIELDFVPSEFFAYLVAAGVALGLVGSLLAVGRFLKV
jgi:cell division transport system permease protein